MARGGEPGTGRRNSARVDTRGAAHHHGRMSDDTQPTVHRETEEPPVGPREIAERYFACWANGDPEPLRPFLSPDVTFDGALGSTRGPEEFLRGLAGMFAATTANEVRLRLADDRDVVTWSELRIADRPAMQVANWTRVENGLITAVRVTFDPRPMLGE